MFYCRCNDLEHHHHCRPWLFLPFGFGVAGTFAGTIGSAMTVSLVSLIATDTATPSL